MANHIPRLFLDTRLHLGEELVLPSHHHKHLVQVLRARTDDPVVLFDGFGGEYSAVLTAINKHSTIVRTVIFHDVNRESSLGVVLGIAILKRDPMNRALEKAVELGASKIVPLITDYVAVSGRQIQTREDSWPSVIRSAAEQCGRTAMPALENPMPLADFLLANADIKLIASPGMSRPLTPSAAGSVAALVGPEGGFSDEEVRKAITQGFLGINLGPRILRADTATAAILTLIQSKWGDCSNC